MTPSSVLIGVCAPFPTAVPPLATNTVSPSLALLASNLSMPPSDLPPGASPRKKPRKQQHVISTEEGDMMETNSTDDEKSTAKSLLVKAEKRKSPPKEYIGKSSKRARQLSPRFPTSEPRQLVSPASLLLQLTVEDYLRSKLDCLVSSPFLF